MNQQEAESPEMDPKKKETALQRVSKAWHTLMTLALIVTMSISIYVNVADRWNYRVYVDEELDPVEMRVTIMESIQCRERAPDFADVELEQACRAIQTIRELGLLDRPSEQE